MAFLKPQIGLFLTLTFSLDKLSPNSSNLNSMGYNRKDAMTDVVGHVSSGSQSQSSNNSGTVSASNGERVTLGVNAGKRSSNRIAKK
jgi:hypothetical protein